MNNQPKDKLKKREVTPQTEYEEFMLDNQSIINLIKVEWLNRFGNANGLNDTLFQIFNKTKNSGKDLINESLRILLNMIINPDYERQTRLDMERNILRKIPKEWIERYYQHYQLANKKKRIFNALKSSSSDSVIKFKDVLKKIIDGK